MSELGEESGTATETLEEALSKNFAALSEKRASTDASPSEEVGDEPSIEAQAEPEAETEQESPNGDALEPLEKWPDEVKTTFRTLDPALQQFLLDRHKDVESHLTKETQSLSDIRKRYERLDEVFKPYESAARQRGVDLTPHVANALQYYFQYQNNPLETVRNLIQSAGLEQSQLFETDDYTDPAIRALKQELRETQNQLKAMQSKPTQEATEAERELRNFTEAKDEQGNPKYPHFDKLRAFMAPLVNEGKTLEEAYEEAQWSLPEHRKAQLEKERKAALKEAESKRAQKVKQAKKASETLPSSDVDASQGIPKFNGKWEDALRTTLEKM